MLMTTDNDSLMSRDYAIWSHLRYCHDPNLGLHERSTRADVRRVRHLIPQVPGIGPVRLAEIDRWLADGAPVDDPHHHKGATTMSTTPATTTTSSTPAGTQSVSGRDTEVQ